ncbi:zinc ribbon domain-containing protein [Christensenellaceae bacterium OttesenSCG-928-K19]|nr:zinc ribbon domain-containing protein [Christensenellaceae bacterium OttesenSCG-928-K19]
MHCIYCKAPLAPGASFCANCGRSINESMDSGAPGIVCPSCRAVLPAGTQFCVNCGCALPEQAAPHSPQPQMRVPEGYVPDPRSGQYYTAAPGNTLPPQNVGRGKTRVFLILLPFIALYVGGLAAFAQAGGFASEEFQEIPPGVARLSLDSYSMPNFQPIDGDDPVYEFGESAGAYESTLDPYSGELLDPYDVRSFWGSFHDAGSFASSMGLSYNTSETERLRKQVDFDLEIYTGPFDHVLPATDRAECYAYVMPTGNVYRFDYKYYMSASASPQEVADTYYAAVDAMGAMVSNTKDLEIFNEDREGFSYDEIAEHVASGTEYYSFRTGFGTGANPVDCSSVMLLKRDGVLSLIMQWIFPLDESPIVQSSSSSESSGSSDSSASSGSSASSDSSANSGICTESAVGHPLAECVSQLEAPVSPRGQPPGSGYDLYPFYAWNRSAYPGQTPNNSSADHRSDFVPTAAAYPLKGIPRLLPRQAPPACNT